MAGNVKETQVFLFSLLKKKNTETLVCLTSASDCSQARASGMGGWASETQEEARTPQLTAHLCRCDRRLTATSLGKTRGPSSWGRVYFSARLDLSSWSISGSVWVLWKQLEETAGCLREDV